MAKRKFIDNALIEKEDLDGVQDFLKEDIDFIIEDGLEYVDLFVGTNFQAVEQTVPDMTVKIIAGKGLIASKITELVADASVTINAAGAIARTDLITCDSALTDDTAEAKLFINPTTELTYTNTVAMKERYVPTFHYYPSTTVVPGGEVGICTILVSPGDVTAVNAMITDVRPAKQSSTLAAHIASNPATHANGSMFNAVIAANADIATTKINGISTDNLKELLELGIAVNSSTDIVFDGSGLPTTITTTGDFGTVTTLTYDVLSQVDTITILSATQQSVSTITWVAGLPTNITTIVTSVP
jgi:hypothetical protein